MKLLLAATTVTVLALYGCATPQSHEGHASHAADSPARASTNARHEHQMQSMSDMHQKMKVARSPEERKALMAEHMKAMQGGMRMMCEMSSDAAPATMKRCMDMHDMTVKMMMEREGSAPPR